MRREHGWAGFRGHGGSDNAVTKPDWLLEGMDPNSTYLLEIRLFGNKKRVRKDIKCFCFDMTVDSDLTNYKDLLEEIVDKYPPGYLEVVHLQYYDHNMKEFPEVHSDQDLLSMFEKNSKTKVVDMFISYCDPSEQFEPIKEWHSDVQMQDAAKNIAEDEDRYLCNPVPENEHVGVDEEVIGPPKKKAKKTKTAESSIVPLDNEAPATSMSFPPSQNLTSNTTVFATSEAVLEQLSSLSDISSYQKTHKHE
ncbi:hypothetical protein C2845_PM09G15390 [Panicum miliaceum]|uniref:Uncharacterized protein n=1 Tax=Panicum miliaceum TaxID=4540 RepID=A0A3L6RXD0_PANMI|nr:hypothetical protein C2845_PM09G15390 [Panicum miliaceum]